MAETFNVSIPYDEALSLINREVVDESITGERIDYYSLTGPNETHCIVAVYEKHYYRAGNRLTLTVTIDDFKGVTRVHSISGGGGEGFFRFDWGASESFAGVVRKALHDYII